MKVIKTGIEVEGGLLELWEPNLRVMLPLVGGFKESGEAALLDILDAVAHVNGEPLENASTVIGGTHLMKLMPLVNEIAGLATEEND